MTSQPKKTMDLVKDYLYCQGYFRTLNAIEKGSSETQGQEKPIVNKLQCEEIFTDKEHETPKK